MRVLIVEASDAICRMIEALVSARGFEVKSAASGARGIEEALTWQPNVVLVDVELPGSFDGIEVCARLHGEPQTAAIPVVVIGSESDDEVKRRAMDAGATAFYEKPFSPLALLKELEGLARRSEAIRL